ncbi:MAG: hypothetical protein U9Q70_11760 [Chloroflexota bacterium]|nr:hypothetical protein [Chloroflexota bacterium]
MAQPYIVLLKHAQLYPPADWPNGVAVYYAPGSISSYTGETLSFCFLEHNGAVLSRDYAHMPRALAQEAVLALDRERRRVAANLPADWPQGIQPEMQHWAKLLFRLHYFEPEHNFVTRLLKLVRQGTRLSRKQRAVIQDIYTERNKVTGLQRRQRQQWRLRQLLAIKELNPQDKKTVQLFQHRAQGKSGLPESQLPVITALEKHYWLAREKHTQLVAQQLVRDLATPPDRWEGGERPASVANSTSELGV